ncbi:MAG TPA: MerR family transcriptional regulator [Clostridia bacterium]|nr:MerR family transcriptional regulator [Clostridia bacterium]
MRLTINEAAKLAGVSVRTLHYYDQIGLLNPSQKNNSGYRLYDESDMEMLQQILFLRELDFPLKNIREILYSPSYDRKTAMLRHKELLKLKRDRLDRLIGLIDKIMKGEDTMSFEEFDMSAIKETEKKYSQEVMMRWGETEAYRQSMAKTKKYKKEDWARISKESDEIFRAFAENMDKSPSAPETQKLVKKWQDHITKYFYQCTNEILSGLGQMYIFDSRFTENIDKYKKGLAQYMSDAIAVYCCKKL